jgi:hypothetical protein
MFAGKQKQALRRSHDSEVAGSNPAPASNVTTYIRGNEVYPELNAAHTISNKSNSLCSKCAYETGKNHRCNHAKGKQKFTTLRFRSCHLFERMKFHFHLLDCSVDLQEVL